MNTELPAKGIFRDEEECAIMGLRGRLYRGGGSILGFMNYVCQLNGLSLPCPLCLYSLGKTCYP